MKARTQTEFARDWVGCVDVKVGENKVKFTSIDSRDGKTKQFPSGDLTLTVKISDLPRYAQRLMQTGKKFRIRLDAEDDSIKTVTPYAGVFSARLVGLGPKDQNGNYKLIDRVFNEGTEKENRHSEFLAIYEISNGPFKGVELPAFYLHYKFEAVPEGDEDEGFTRFNTVDTPQASQLHKLQQWAEVHGNILDEPIVWPDDGIILETLEERALDEDRSVQLVFEKGYIKSVQPSDDYEEIDIDAEDALEEVLEEKPAPKKEDGVKTKARKTPAKKSKQVDEEDDL